MYNSRYAAAEASFIADRRMESGILLETDGSLHNVIKIRPPMPFSQVDADILVEDFDGGLLVGWLVRSPSQPTNSNQTIRQTNYLITGRKAQFFGHGSTRIFTDFSDIFARSVFVRGIRDPLLLIWERTFMAVLSITNNPANQHPKMDPRSPYYRQARDDFRRARRQAQLKEIVNWVRGKPNYLLPFEIVRKHLRATGEEKRGLQQVPLDAIIGSVGRYSDFTRDFLPRSDFAQNRWTRVKAAFRSLEEMPPVDLYQIGEAYFVLDGNHRVSIARGRGAKVIAAYVTKIQSKVPLTPDTDLDELILKAEYATFLEATQFDILVPEANLAVTVPGRYKIITDQIAQFHQAQGPSFSDSLQEWYAQVYLPVIKIIRARGILRDFPNRTETDLFVWILSHQERLQAN